MVTISHYAPNTAVILASQQWIEKGKSNKQLKRLKLKKNQIKKLFQN